MTQKREDVARIDAPEMTAEQRAISAAATVFRNHGMDIGCPWEGSLDDVEQERFKALVEAINAYKSSAPQDRDVGGLIEALKVADAAINPRDRDGISLHIWNERLKEATKVIRAALEGAKQ